MLETTLFILSITMVLSFFYRYYRDKYRHKDNNISLTDLLVSTLDQFKSSAFIISVATGKIQFVNSFALDQLGYAREDLLDKPVDSLDVDGVNHSLKGQCQHVLSNGEDSVYFDTLIREKKGGARAFEVFLQKMNSGKDGLFFTVIMRDITERKRIEKIQHQLIATVSHELRTPLTSIKGSLGLLESKDLDLLPEKTKFLIEMARKNSDRLMYLINDILDLERFRHKDLAFDLVDAELGDILQESVVAIEPYAKQFSVDVAFVQPQFPMRVLVESERILQVLNNLLSNAIKFSGEGSVVHVNTQVLGDRVRVNIVDEGSGIPENMRERVFQPFARSHDDKSRVAGSGLGLPISAAIIEAHNGFLSFDSQEGVGTRFYFELPLQHADHGSSSPQLPEETSL